MTIANAKDRTIVVGSGIVGIACAHYLAQAGLPVTVIDRGAIGGGCSHANCGYVCPSHVLPLTEPGAIRTALRSLFDSNAPFRVKPRWSPALWYWMWQFARRCTRRQMLAAGTHLKAILDSSVDEYRRLMSTEGWDCQWKQNGLLYVLQTEHGMREFAETDRLLTDHFHVSARRIEGPELPAFDPALRPGLAGAFHYPGDASLRPDRLNAQWSLRLQQQGVEFIEQCELRGMENQANRITRLVTSQGILSPERVIFALGAWSPRWAAQLQCRIPVQPGKGYSVTLACGTGGPRYPLLFPEHRVGLSPFDDGLRLGSIMEFAGYDSSIPPRRIEQLRAAARHYIHTPVDGDGEPWYGWRPMTWDSLPVIGRAGRWTNAYLATGHNMLGLSLATGTGKLLAEIVLGQPTHLDPAPYSPARF